MMNAIVYYSIRINGNRYVFCMSTIAAISPVRAKRSSPNMEEGSSTATLKFSLNDC
jgi:hypothetical protein